MKSIYLKTFILITTLLLVSNHLFAYDAFRDDRDFRSINIYTGPAKFSHFGKISSFSLNPKCRIMAVIDSDSNVVYIFHTNGTLLREIGSTDGIKTPLAAAIDNNENIYVSQVSESKIHIFKPKSEKSVIDIPVTDMDSPPSIVGLTIDRKGNVYAADKANSRIYAFDSNGKLKLQFGAKGDKRGEFKSLEDLAVDSQGRIYVLDSSNSPIQVFNNKGKYLYKIGFKGMGKEDIANASGIYIDPNDQIWAADSGSHKLKVFSRNGEHLRNFGSYGTAPSQLFQPIDLAMDSFGYLYIAEAGAKRIQIFMLRHTFERFTNDSF